MAPNAKKRGSKRCLSLEGGIQSLSSTWYYKLRVAVSTSDLMSSLPVTLHLFVKLFAERTQLAARQKAMWKAPESTGAKACLVCRRRLLKSQRHIGPLKHCQRSLLKIELGLTLSGLSALSGLAQTPSCPLKSMWNEKSFQDFRCCEVPNDYVHVCTLLYKYTHSHTYSHLKM